MNTKWQAEQMPYPHDADYIGAKAGLFDPSKASEKLIGELNAGDTFIYLFRRFGYPRFGWDGYKKLIQYHLTTPMTGVVLTVEPNVTGGGTFGYMLREDIAQACATEERKPYEDWMAQFEKWVLNEHGIEVILMLEQDNDKLNRVWQKWGADKEDREFASEKDAHNAFFTDQEDIRAKYVEMYKEIEPYPKTVRIEDLPDDSIMKQCHKALCDTIRDLLRPVYVRDVMIDIKGEIVWERDMDVAECAKGSGCGVGDKLVGAD